MLVNKLFLVFLLAISFSIEALSCESIDEDFELNGELVSERMSSNEEEFQKTLPLTITTMLNAGYPKLVGEPNTIAVHIKSDSVTHELLVTHLLDSGQLGKQIKHQIICDEGRLLIYYKGSSTSGGMYRKAESKTWVTLEENGALLVHDLVHRTEGMFFKENYFHERVVKFQVLNSSEQYRNQ